MKISVVGSINMDISATVSHLPKKGETLLGNELHIIPGGKGANQAVALGKIGANVSLFGCIGNDEFGRMAISNLQENRIDTSHIKIIPNVSTGVALITVGDNDNSIVVVPGANFSVDKHYIDSIKVELLKSDFVILQLEIPIETVQYVVDICNHAGIKVLLNPAPAQKLADDLISKLDYITPNEHEAEIVFGISSTLQQLMQLYPEKLVVTLGSAGVSTALMNGELLNVPAVPSKVVDTTGAGDTFNGSFAFAISNHQTINEALLFANAAAGLSTEKFGAQGGMPTYDEIIDRLSIFQ